MVSCSLTSLCACVCRESGCVHSCPFGGCDPPQVDTPSCSARELSLAAARLDAHLYWSISSRLDEEPTLISQAAKQADSSTADSRGDPALTLGEMTNIQEQPGLGELNGSVTTDQSETQA